MVRFLVESPPDLLETQVEHVTVPDHVVFRSFADETVVLNLESGRYHGLNRTAGRMLELLGELGRVDAVADRVADETGAARAQVAADLRELCVALEQRGLIEFGSAT